MNKLSDQETSLLNGRIFLQLPVEARVESRHSSVMGAAEPATRESRVVVEQKDKKLVLMVYELFRISGGHFLEEAKSDFGKLQNYRFKQTSDKQLAIVHVMPEKLDTSRDAIFIWGVYFQNPNDHTVQYLAFYINPVASDQDKSCQQLAQKIASSIRAGKGSLSTLSGRHVLKDPFGSPNFELQVREHFGYSLQRGPDFSVHLLEKIVRLGQSAPTVGFYVGAHPSLHHRGHPKEKMIQETLSGKLLGEDVQWVSWHLPSSDTKETVFSQETLVPVKDRDQQLYVHIFINSRDQSELNTLQSMVRTLKLLPSSKK